MRTKFEIEAEIAICQKKLEAAYNHGWVSNAEDWSQKIAELQKESNCPSGDWGEGTPERNVLNPTPANSEVKI